VPCDDDGGCCGTWVLLRWVRIRFTRIRESALTIAMADRML
jgi:hypothetical protein